MQIKRFAYAALSATVLLGACATPLPAQAQFYDGRGDAYERPQGPPPWAQERWVRWEARHRYWAQQRQREQQHAYEAGRRDAYHERGRGYRGG